MSAAIASKVNRGADFPVFRRRQRTARPELFETNARFKAVIGVSPDDGWFADEARHQPQGLPIMAMGFRFRL